MFLETLDNLMKKRGLNKNSFSKESGIAYTTIDGFYKKGYDNVKLSTLRQVANFFHVSLDYLVDGEDSQPVNKDMDENRILNAYRKLNSIGKKAALDRVNDLTYNPKYMLSGTKSETDEYDDAFPISDMVAYDMDDMIEQDPMEDFDEVSTTADR